MNKKFLLIMFCMIVLVGFASASLDSLGTYKQHDCMTISQVCASCTYVNISSISNNVNATLVSEIEMVDFGGGEWRYEFCITETIGRYDVRGQGDIGGTDTSFATYFEITPSGFVGTLGFFILLLVLSLGVIILGYSIQDAWVVILGGFALILVGLFILFYGIDGMKDVTYTWGVGLITLMLGAYFTIKGSLENINL